MAHIVREPLKKTTDTGNEYWEVQVYQAIDKVCVYTKIFDTEEQAENWKQMVEWQMQEGFQW